MKSYKELRAALAPIKLMFATIGQHSIEKKETGKPKLMFGTIGQHSIEKKEIKEGFEPSAKELGSKHMELAIHHSNFNKNHIKHIKRYTDSSTGVNKFLYNRAKGDPVNTDYHEHAEGMKDATKAHTTPSDMHVFTGLRRNPRDQIGKSKKETTFHFPAFTSTSLSHNVATSFTVSTSKPNATKLSNHVLKIHVPEGSHGAYVSHHSSQTGNEHEFILHPDAQIKIHHKPDVDSDGLHTWHGTLIHDGVKSV